MSAVDLDAIRAARATFGDAVRRTPILPSSTLSAISDGTVRLKAENLQHTGSFKIRGASNRLAALTADERARGVITASAGNHAQGLAVAARSHGVRATIVMPRIAPLAKVEATRDYGAEVVLHGESYDEARIEAERLAAERGLLMIHAFNDPLIVAGQGTLGLEVIEDLPEVDTVIVPIGGGGLIGGVATAIKAVAPRVRIIGVQAHAAPGSAQSWRTGEITNVAARPTIADGIAAGAPGTVTLPLMRQLVDDIVLVDEDEIAQAIVLLLERSKLVVEGAGAVGVAAVMARTIDLTGRNAVIVLSGGNIDLQRLARVVEHGLTEMGRYYSLTIGLDDKPGQLAMLSALIADTGANVLSLDHHRFGIAMSIGRVQVALLLEVRNRAHAGEVGAALEAHGFMRGRAGEPTFMPRSWERED